MNNSNFEFTKERDDEMGIGAHKWYGSEDRTDTHLLHDENKGDAIVIRNFEFTLKPGIEKPTREQILTPEYIKHLQTLLWADSLKLVLEPRVQITKEKILVSVPCQARTGATIMEEPKYLQEIL